MVLTAAAAILISLKLGMNPTEGQKLALGGIGQGFFTANSGIPLALGFLVFLAGLAVSSLLRLPHTAASTVKTWHLRLILTPFLAAAGAWGAIWFRQQTLNTHDCYSDGFSNIVFPVLGGILGAALALGGTRPRADASLAALGAVLLVALYGGKFDYHFADALFLGIAAGFPAFALTGSSQVSPASPRRGPPWAAMALIFLTFSGTAFWHLRSSVRLYVQQERTAALITLYEQAMRSGKLAPQDVGMASFGYLGWLFQDYYAAHDGRAQPVLGGFSRYAQNWDQGRGTGILTTLPKSLNAWRGLIPTRNRAALRDTPGVPVLLEIKHPFFLRHPVRFTLLRGPSEERVPGSLTLDPTQYQRPVYPLTDSEWRYLILEAPPLR